jgi:hypothetical protein
VGPRAARATSTTSCVWRDVDEPGRSDRDQRRRRDLPVLDASGPVRAATTLPGSGKLTLSNYFKEYDATNGPYATVNVPKGMCTETWDNGVKSSDYPYSDQSFSVRVTDVPELQLVSANVSPGSGTVSIGALSDKRHAPRKGWSWMSRASATTRR